METAGDGTVQSQLDRAQLDRAAARAAAEAWSRGRPFVDRRRQRFGILFVAAGFVLMAGGVWLVVFVG